MNPKQFLAIAGVLFLLLGILGLTGITGPTPATSVFGAAWYFGDAENWAYIALGVIAIAGAFTLPTDIRRIVALVIGILGIITGLYSAASPFMVGIRFLGAEFQNPADTVLHLIVGTWALWVAIRRPKFIAPL